ncbi:hypothetical protein METHB2_10044 [Candidatus Methylobacter favarea]|uniref:Uncharacterized protein n=1 Tax=Candidatus Methylobacter favarea TaxID=2707345 RepID=A0A8S0W8C2_9GAMM|nr:hypothetical protein METHB2_10044 [Candidatus Methylobacter favarea]
MLAVQPALGPALLVFIDDTNWNSQVKWLAQFTRLNAKLSSGSCLVQAGKKKRL